MLNCGSSISYLNMIVKKFDIGFKNNRRMVDIFRRIGVYLRVEQLTGRILYSSGMFLGICSK